MTQTNRSSKVKSVWFSHLKTKQEQEDFVKTLLNRRNGDVVYDRISQIIEERLSQIERLETDITSYDSPGWTHKQAHINGRYAELKLLLDLMKN